MTNEIQLSQGKVALIDDEDYEGVSAFKWSLKSQRHGYAGRIDAATGKYVLMHRIIMAAPRGVEVDHINGNTLDNRRSNLRLCTRGENSRNKRPAVKHSAVHSMFKGVTWMRRQRQWQARITIAGSNQYLGLFRSETEAAYAYDAAARQYHGEFARLNFPNEA